MGRSDCDGMLPLLSSRARVRTWENVVRPSTRAQFLFPARHGFRTESPRTARLRLKLPWTDESDCSR